MSELRYSIADLIDRLAITLLKHWHLEEQIAEDVQRITQVGGVDNLTEEEAAAIANRSDGGTRRF